MANLKSSKKDIRRIARRTERNTATSSRLKTLRKKAVGDATEADKSAYASALDKAAKAGVIHPNKVSREKSKISRGSLHSKNRH
ncbi:MAG: 30S ribosomal protein S20 [Opitutales bacterium]|jgi:small subunit ribosomal protein S20